MVKREMARIKCNRYPDQTWTDGRSYERSRALQVIALIEREHSEDSTKGCPGPHELVSPVPPHLPLPLLV